MWLLPKVHAVLTINDSAQHGATRTHTPSSAFMPDIVGVRLFSLDNWHTWGSTDTLDQNKDVYLVKEFETVLIGRAPQITKGTRPLPDNSWVLPCPVLSRSHAVLSLTKDQVW